MRYALILVLSVSMYAQVSPAFGPQPSEPHGEPTDAVGGQGKAVSSGGPVAQVESKKIVSPAWETPGPEASTHRAPLEIIHWAAASADAAQTCYFLSQPNTHEDFLPTQHCLPAAGMILGQTAIEELIARKLQRHHPKWAKVVRLYGITDSLFAISYSKARGAW